MVLLRGSSARTVIQWLSWLGVAVGVIVVVTLQWALREQGSTRTGLVPKLVLPRHHCGWWMDDDRDLAEMALIDCALHRLDTTIQDFSRLKQLDLAGNHLVDLPPLPPSLEVLLLQGNRFERIPMPISTLPKLRMLSLKGCRLGEVDLPLPQSLEWLILTNNGLRELPPSLGRCTKLRKLMLSNNALTRLPNALAQLSALEVLRVANNKLAPPLPEWLFDGVALPTLTWLAIAGNPAVEPAPALSSSFINGSELDSAEHDHLFLGEGASGVVQAVTWRQKQVAVKRFKTELTSDGKIADELRAATSVEHPNILRTIGFSLEPAPIVITEYDPSLKSLAGPPSLMSITRDVYPDGTTFTAAFIQTVACGIAAAMAHLHSHNISHGDLYAHNILVSDDRDGTHGNNSIVVKLSDFGAAFYYGSSGAGSNLARYAAAFEGMDARAFALLLTELLARYDGLEGKQEEPQNLQGVRLLAVAMQQPTVDASARPTFEQAQQHLEASPEGCAKAVQKQALKTDDEVGYCSTTSPFYADPLFDGAHDAELVWHQGEQCWWLTYLQNRYNSCTKRGRAMGPTTGTDLGLASTPDGGKTWIYRGVMAGLDVPDSDRKEPLPPGSTTAQYGGATWWRPAVITVAGVYHGFFSQWEQSHEWGLWKVIHYTSTDMKNWQFRQYVRNSTCPPKAPVTANCTSAYDSAVFSLKDGRFALFSAGPSPGFTGPHPPMLCTRDLHLLQWEECEESLQLYKHLDSLKQSVGAEGAHVIDRNASVEFEGWSWMNWEGRGPKCKGTTCTSGTPNLARSSDGGLSWLASTTNLWGEDHGNRKYDAGQVAFQGPLLLQRGQLFALYFTEFDTNNSTAYSNTLPGCSVSPTCRGISDHRSMLQIARVHLDQRSGWLHGNRSEPFTLSLQPPANAPPPRLPVIPKVWAVAKVEAAAIALAEIDRWIELAPSGKLSTKIVSHFKLAEASYLAQATQTVEDCVAACNSTTDCSAVTYCANRTMRFCECAGKGIGCCFMIDRATDVAAGTCARSNCGSRSSDACQGWFSFSKFGLRTSPADYTGDEYQRWRNPLHSVSYFDSITKSGDGNSTVWRLTHVRNDTCSRCGGNKITFQIAVVANGTITELRFNGSPLVPLQWRRQ